MTDDDDANWHRNEAERWEKWRRAKDEAPPPPEAAALAKRPAKVDPSGVRRSLGVLPRDDDEAWMDLVHRVRCAAEIAAAAGHGPVAVACAITGIALIHGATQNDDFAVSEARDGAAAVEERRLGAVLEAASPTDKASARGALEGEAAEVGLTVRRYLGADIADLPKLQKRYKAAKSPVTRAEIALAIVADYAPHLSSEELLDLCRQNGLHTFAVEHLIAERRMDEAFKWAKDGTSTDDPSGRPHPDLGRLAKAFVAAGEPARAEQLVRPYARNDFVLAELRARALVALKSPDAPAALRDWFRQRKNDKVRAAILALAPGLEL